jgi:AcrR family transcriptional regulator
MQGMASERRYTSTRRAQQAAATRQDVIAAGIELFAESGWAGTTIAALAERAGVAVETIYAGFGSKRGVLRAAMDAAVVGDADPIPLVDRPEFARLQEGSLEERVAACAKLVTDIHRRSAGVWRAIVEAASAEAEVAAWRDELEANRRVDVARSLERTLDRRVTGRLLDLAWALLGPEIYLKLVVDAGMSRKDYERCMADAIVGLATIGGTAERSR